MNIKLIEKYIDGHLNADEKLEFAHKLHVDQDFRQEVETYKQLVSVIRMSGRKQEIAQTHREFLKEYRKPATPFQWKAVAAAVTIFLLSTTLLVSQFPTTGSVYQDTYIPYKVRVLRSSTNDSMLSAYYADSKFDMVLRAYEKMETPSAKDHLIAGNAYLQNQQAELALNSFQLVELTGNEELVQIAQWYEAMAFLALDQPAKAYTVLEKIKKEPTHLFHHNTSNWLMVKVKFSDIF